MALSSINFQKVSTHALKHNDRTEEKTAKTVFAEFSHKNICDTDSNEALQNFNDLYKDSISNITGRERRADKKNTMVEAVVNIKPNTTMADLKNLQKHIEKELGFKGLQIAIHRDEGYFDEKGKFITNDHAHMNFFTLDRETGRQMFRREHITKDKLRDLQTQTAIILNMDRGKSKEETGRERLSHKDHKQAKKMEALKEKEIKVLKKENSSLKGQNTKLMNSKAVQKELLEALKLENIELQSKLLKREEHAQREALNTKFKAEIKARDVTIEEIKVKFKELEEKLIPKLEKEISHLKSVIQVKDLDITDLNNQNKSLQAQKEVLASKVTTLEEKTAHSSNIAPSDVLMEFKKIHKEEIQEKTAILKFGKIQVLENPDSFIKKVWNLINSKYNQLLEEVKALRFENKAMKIEIAQLKDKAQTIVPKQQKESSDIFEKIQSEAKRNLEATFLVDKEKEITTTPKIRRDR